VNGKEIIKRVSPLRGKSLSEEHKKKIGDAHRGDKNKNWAGGLITITCIMCGAQKKVKRNRCKGRFCSRSCATIWRNKNDKEARLEGIRKALLSRPRVSHTVKCIICGTEKTVRCDAKLQKFCSRSCAQKTRTGARNSKWRGGKIKLDDGRVAVYAPGHPNANLFGGTHILEYRLIAEKKVGRPLFNSEVVHHVNGDPTDNDINNLQIMTPSEHALIHVANRRKKTLLAAIRIKQNYGGKT